MNGESRPEGRPTGVDTHPHPTPNPVDECAFALADAAIARNSYIECATHGIGAISDSLWPFATIPPHGVMVDEVAAGLYNPDATIWCLRRPDGRSATIYPLPSGGAR